MTSVDGDAAVADTSVVDAPALDTPVTDAGPRPDVAAMDVATSDVPVADAPTTDHTTMDTGPVDTGSVDAPGDVPADTGAPQADACVRPAIAPAPTMQYCGTRTDGAACGTGYTCLPFSGVVLQEMCGRPCAVDCDCATGDHCGSYTDKAGRHPICVGGA